MKVALLMPLGPRLLSSKLGYQLHTSLLCTLSALVANTLASVHENVRRAAPRFRLEAGRACHCRSV